MSAFIAVKHPNRVQLLTDGARYNQDHVLTGIVCKVWSAASVPLAITGRGNLQVVEHIAREIIAEADAEGSVDRVTESFLPEYVEDIRAAGVKDCDLAIAVHSETTGPGLYFFDTGGKLGNFKFQRQDSVWCAVELTGKELYDLAGARFLTNDPAYLDEKGADLMELIRSKPTQGYYSVGGHCQLTTVTAEGVETVTLRRWPQDAVGSKIDPAGRPTNRHERRAAAARRAA
ncbi:hypothetical protein CK218_22275 [Mesorhizobium sp. WSM3879]|uniref:hypothetical protein n=1 Tax=Mesorhizobium sp. WSM3879 TaxID=2029406 RepID=UPI000BB000A0|nr:hypothetical protein [Mesorhizobium sp. WSM3879]PBB79079.1 hypothetical protein CK218_22275 [Mesorhizobium sp. WSM3879]